MNFSNLVGFHLPLNVILCCPALLIQCKFTPGITIMYLLVGRWVQMGRMSDTAVQNSLVKISMTIDIYSSIVGLLLVND